MIPNDGTVIGSIGCGYAATENVLMGEGRQVHGVDIASVAIEIAKKRLTSARLIEPNNLHPFEDESLDGLILADVIEHIPLANDALRSFVRAVKPGGWVVISVPNMRQVEVLYSFFLRGDWPEEATGIFDRTHLQVMSKKRLRRWCRDAGLIPEKWFDVYSPFGPRRYHFFHACDLLTLKLLNSWWVYQLQVCCRKPASK